MAEYISVPLWNVKVIPDDMYLVLLLHLVNLRQLPVHAVNKIDNISGKTVCISGSGTIGILASMIAKSKGQMLQLFCVTIEKKLFLKV